MRILILYHSGAGNTKLISELITERLKQKHEIEISHINNKYNNNYLKKFDLLIFGFPTHHAEPSLSMTEFVNRLVRFDKHIESFIFTTYGLYSGNSLRIFTKQLDNKNIKVLFYEEFKSPATDGVLLFSEKIRFMFKFENKLNLKINYFVEQVENCKKIKGNNIPHYKWYVPLNDIIKPLGIKYYEKLKRQMQIISDQCTNCNLCVAACERSAWISSSPTPIFIFDNCEFCLQCVHECPTEAIIFSDKMKFKPRLSKNFFIKQKEEIIGAQK